MEREPVTFGNGNGQRAPFESRIGLLFCSLVRIVMIAVLMTTATGNAAETGLHNLIRVSDRIYSGAGPEDEADFDAIRKLGANTILSVDGARPAVDAAHAKGMRYIHVPIGYDGITREQAAQLSQAMEDTTGTIYIHCHHGQHRGPAAAALAWRLSSDCSVTSATEVLKQAKTGKDYKGLWAAMNMEDLPALRREHPTLVETAKVADLAARMVLIDNAMDRLDEARKAGWTAPPNHPDVDPAQEALMVQEHFHEIGRMNDSKFQEDFHRWREQAEGLAKQLREDLKTNNTTSAATHYGDLRQSCRSCHSAHRDNRR